MTLTGTDCARSASSISYTAELQKDWPHPNASCTGASGYSQQRASANRVRLKRKKSEAEARSPHPRRTAVRFHSELGGGRRAANRVALLAER
jgi:hypothetical protein